MSDNPQSVLVVDDEPEVRDLTSRALAANQIPCDIAGDGEEALKMASRRAYGAVITDLRMPRRHGHALCGDLIKLPHPPKVMVLTALADARLVRDLLERGVHDVIQKPVNYDVLATKVEAMLRADRKPAGKATKSSQRPNAKKANLLHQIEASLVEMTEAFGEKLDTVFESSEDMPEPPRSVREFIRRLAEGEASSGGRPRSIALPTHEDREKSRVTCYTTVVAVPVDRRLKRLGVPFKLALRDLSESGCRLLHTRATNAQHLALCWNATQLVAKQIRVIVQLRRCAPLSPFYDYGCQFAVTD